MSHLVSAGLLVPSIRIYSGESASWLLPVGIVCGVILGVLWLMARVRESRDKQARQEASAHGHDTGAFQQDHAAGSVQRGAAVTTATVGEQGADAARSTPALEDRAAAWAEVFDPTTTADRLAQIAAYHPEFAPQLAAHPNSYPELRAWAASAHGGPIA